MDRTFTVEPPAVPDDRSSIDDIDKYNAEIDKYNKKVEDFWDEWGQSEDERENRQGAMMLATWLAAVICLLLTVFNLFLFFYRL